MIQLTAVLIAGLVFEIYRDICLHKFNMTRSFSFTYYKWNKKNMSWAFTIFIFSFSLPMAIAMSTYLGMVAAGLICVSGVAADTKRDKQTEKLHSYSVIIGIVLAFLSIGVDFGQWWLAVIGATIVLGTWMSQIKYHTYWTELQTILIIIIAVVREYGA